MGPYFDIALDVSKDEARSGGPVAWVNVEGFSDVVIWSDANTRAEGSGTRRDFCLTPSVWVVNLRAKTRRKIPVRGKLRVRVSYFSTQGDFESYRDNPEQRKDSLLWSETYLEIPCRPASRKSDCTRMPVGVEGEMRIVPEVRVFSDWNARGDRLTRELARKSSSNR